MTYQCERKARPVVEGEHDKSWKDHGWHTTKKIENLGHEQETDN